MERRRRATPTRAARSLDIVRAPNRDPDGLRIHGVQPFLWQTSEGDLDPARGHVPAAQRPAQRHRLAASPTRSPSRATTPRRSAAAARVVAQDDQNLDAEWGLSSFDRRHQLDGRHVSVELPFGPNRPWLNGGGVWAALLERLAVSTTFTWQSGTPFTPRVTGAVGRGARHQRHAARRTTPARRSRVDEPTIARFFNTAAFAVPATGTFGNASRNMIIGPGTQQLDAPIRRDVRLSATGSLTLQLNANNLLNMVRFGAIDTVVNSPTFGQVVTIRPMRTRSTRREVQVLMRRTGRGSRPLRRPARSLALVARARGAADASGRSFAPTSMSSSSTSSCAIAPAPSCAG